MHSFFPYFICIFPPIYTVYCFRSETKSPIYFLFVLFFLTTICRITGTTKRNTLLSDQIFQAGWEEVENGWLMHTLFIVSKPQKSFIPVLFPIFPLISLSMGGIHSEMPKHNKSVWCRVEWACVLGSNSRLCLASTVWPWTSHLSFLSPKLLILKINRSISNLHIHSVYLPLHIQASWYFQI